MVSCERALSLGTQGVGSRNCWPHFLLREEDISVQAISWVIERSKHKSNAFVVLLMIANHAKSDGTGAWPSVRSLARESRISPREVQYTLRQLESSGELETKVGNGPRGCNLYSIPGVLRYAKFAPPPTQDTCAPPTHILAPEPSFNSPKPKSVSHASRVGAGPGENRGFECRTCGETFTSHGKLCAHECLPQVQRAVGVSGRA